MVVVLVDLKEIEWAGMMVVMRVLAWADGSKVRVMVSLRLY